MQIQRFTSSLFAVNSYLVMNGDASRAILIDAGEDFQTILQALRNQNLTLVYLINTHGHGDHIAGNEPILRETGAQLLIGELDAPFLQDPELNVSKFFGYHLVSPAADRLLKEGDVIELDDIRLTVIHTPGHTPGHISLIGEGFAFVGDVIFRESVGRTDLPYGSMEQLARSIREKIYALPDDTVLYPGHGPETTVGHEKRFNPFVRG